MRRIAILTIEGYQIIVAPLLHQLLGVGSACRFEVRCTEFAKTQIKEKGVITGVLSATNRVLKCQPFYNVK